ncbi:zinc ribbon domain-containing protein [Paenibacillus vulneris]|uniref:Zinc ribbon domain-containing protein n=1 Tax=Paenibacillus vulneris TaxID=1133364 RepID=A0ABW3UI42_9BACL
MYQFTSKIKCLHCQGNYRGKKLRDKLAYSCSTYEKKGKDECSNNFKIREEELVHIVSTHLQLNGGKADGSLGDYVRVIEVENGGYKIYYHDGDHSIVNDRSSPYGTKFKY